MIKITEKQRLELAPLIPRLDELLAEPTDEALLLAIDDLIIDELDDSQNYLSEDGIKLHKLYDEIFESND